MRSYLRYWLEVFRLPVIPPPEILGRMRAAGEEQTAFRHLAAGRGVIFALPHMGNWEHAGAWIVLRGAGKVTTVAERLRPESLYDRFVAFRERLGMEVLPYSAGASRFGVLAQRLRAGGLVALLCERDLTGSGIEVEFFGEPARIMGGPAALAEQTGAALMPVTLWYEGENWGAHIHQEIPVPRDRYRTGEDRRRDPAAGEGVREWDRQAPGGLAHAAEGVRGRSRHRQAARCWPATAGRRVTAPRFTSERTSPLLGEGRPWCACRHPPSLVRAFAGLPRVRSRRSCEHLPRCPRPDGVNPAAGGERFTCATLASQRRPARGLACEGTSKTSVASPAAR
jgi:Bacterial lipid A biosynthesis acyltransferase